MLRPPFHTEANTYTLYGALFGLGFPLAASLIVSLSTTGAVSLAAIWEAQTTNPLLWIINTAPFFLGLFARLAGRRQDALRQHVLDRDDLIAAQTAELRQALADARAAAEAKSTFLAIMSHEVRTPLNGVLGMVQVLDDTDLNHEQRECLSTIRDSSEALLTILTDVLDFAALDVAGGTLTLAPFDLHAVLTEAVTSSVSLAAQRCLPLNLLIHHDTPVQVVGDRRRIRQVLLNLLNNAVKFTHQGEIFVEVMPLCEDTDVVVQVAVQDTGIGIAPSEVDHLFQPFNQVDPSLKRRYSGTGLGLAICRTLCEQMGGRIWVESTPKEGSTFTFTVRLELTAPPSSAPAPTPRFEGRSLLVVGPCAGLRRVLGHLSDRWGFELMPVTSIAAGLAYLTQRHTPDALLLTENVSDTDASRFADALRQAPVLTPLPILHVTTPLAVPNPSLGALPSYHPLPAPVTAETLRSAFESCWRTDARSANAATVPTVAPSAGSLQPPTFDRALFEHLRDVEADGDLAFVQTLLHQFLDDAQAMLAEMQQAYREGDVETVRFLAHKLTSSSRLFGACRLSTLCREAEHGTPSPALLNQMLAEFTAVSENLLDACAAS